MLVVGIVHSVFMSLFAVYRKIPGDLGSELVRFENITGNRRVRLLTLHYLSSGGHKSNTNWYQKGNTTHF